MGRPCELKVVSVSFQRVGAPVDECALPVTKLSTSRHIQPVGSCAGRLETLCLVMTSSAVGHALPPVQPSSVVLTAFPKGSTTVLDVTSAVPALARTGTALVIAAVVA